MPLSGFESNVTRYNWWSQCVVHDSVTVRISIENLDRKTQNTLDDYSNFLELIFLSALVQNAAVLVSYSSFQISNILIGVVYHRLDARRSPRLQIF